MPRILTPYQKPPLGAMLDRSHPLAKGLVGCWLMNESLGTIIYNSSGNLTNGVLIGGTWSGGGIRGGTGGITDLGNPPELGITGNSLSLEVLYRPHASGAANTNKQFITKWPNGFVLGYENAANNRIWCVVYVGSSKTAYGVVPVSDVSINYHIVGVYDGANVIVYVNGIPGSPIAATGNISSTAANVQIGSYDDGSQPVAGVMQYARTYNRALTQQEIQSLYFSPYAMFSLDTDFLYWKQPAAGGSILRQMMQHHGG